MHKGENTDQQKTKSLRNLTLKDNHFYNSHYIYKDLFPGYLFSKYFTHSAISLAPNVV